MAQHISSARAPDHLRHLVSGNVKWVKPFEANDATSRKSRHASSVDLALPRVTRTLLNDGAGLFGTSRGFTHSANIRTYVWTSECGLSATMPWLALEASVSAAPKSSGVSGADVAKLLRHDKVWLNRGQGIQVHAVEALASLEEFLRVPGCRWRQQFRCARCVTGSGTGLFRASGGKSHSWLTPAI